MTREHSSQTRFFRRPLRGATGLSLAASIIGAIACTSTTADLGSGPQYRPTYANEAPPPQSDPPPISGKNLWKLVDGEGQIVAMAVDRAQAFWLALPDPVPPWDSQQALLRCDVAGCKASIEQLGLWPPVDDGVPYEIDPIALDATRVYPRPISAWNNDLIACSRDDCNQPQTLVGSKPGGSIENPVVIAAVDGTLVLRTDDGLARCDLANCEGTMSPLPSPPAPDVSTSFPKAYAVEGGFVYAAMASGTVYRTRIDGTNLVEVVAENQNVGQLAVRGDSIYWTEPVALGSVKTCPKTGCLDEPKRLMTDLNRPQRIAADDQYVYVMEPCNPRASAVRDRILRCDISGCDAPTVLVENVGAMSDLFLDDQNLYFAGAPSCGCIDEQGTNHCLVTPATGEIEPLIVFDYYVAAVPK
jgi:hypothetical protein